MTKKKDPNDLTGIHELPQAEELAAEVDPFAVNEMPANEQIDSFDSLEEVGMMDHPAESTSNDMPSDPLIEPFSNDFFASETVKLETQIGPSEEIPILDSSFASDPLNPIVAFDSPEPLFTNPMEDLKTYSENTRILSSEVSIHYPFHLYIQGQFGPFERDKLLLFITENQVGISSQDLDLQIKSGRVFFSRISEYASIRLIQELRDSGLSFSLKPSERDDDEPIERSAPLHFQFDAPKNSETPNHSIAVLPENSTLLAQYEEFDSIQTHQFIKAEMIEVERSDLFQEVIERMTESLKHKARLKGGQALYRLTQTINPLRLPSQYQISVSAVILKAKNR